MGSSYCCTGVRCGCTQLRVGRSLVHKSTAAAGGGSIGPVDGAVTIRTAVGQRCAGTVVVASMALQTECRFTHAQQIRVGGTVRTVAKHTILRHRRMLVGEGSAMLRMATQTELVAIGHAQVVPGRPTVRIMAICATHLSFPQRMVVRQAHLTPLGLVTT